jgi:hypothetical protein
MGRGAMIGGFLAGCVVTVAALSFLASERKKKKSHDQSRTVAAILASNVDHVNFLADILARLWPYINVAGGDMIRDTVEPMFSEMMPGPFKSLHFTKVDLGKVPILLDNIVVHELKDGVVQFDLDVIWNSDSDIQLQADFGIKFGVKTIKLNGRMVFLLKPLTNVIPCVAAVQYSFINPPNLELDFTGLANIADFTIIDKTIRKIMQDIMASMVVLPYRMLYKMDLACDFKDIYQPPKGVARITCVKGRGFQVEKRSLRGADIPDVYCVIQMGCVIWRTSTVKDNLSPEWNESKDFMLSDNDQIISIEAWDEDKGALDSDDFLGSSKVTVGDLLLAGTTLELDLLDEEAKSTGAFVTIRCDVCKFTSSDLSSLEGAVPSDNTIFGLLTIIITRAFNLPVKKMEAASFVKVTYGGSHEFVTGVVTDYPGYDALNPLYDMAFNVPLVGPQDPSSAVKLDLMNGEKLLGSTTVEYAALVSAPDRSITERRNLGEIGASLEFAIYLSGVDQPSAIPSVFATPAPAAQPSQTGAAEHVSVTIASGRGFKIKKKFLKDDVPDVYCEVKFGSSPQLWRTKTIKNSVTPKWEKESSAFFMTSPNQVISLDVYDENRKGKNRYLGSARITVGKVLLDGGSSELELQENGTGTGAFITIQCHKIDSLS